MRRIICIGNRYVFRDAAGCAVYDRIREWQPVLPDDIDVVDGGVAGLNLLSLVEETECVVFVDSIMGATGAGGLVTMTGAEVAALADETYSHAAGLPYLLRVLPGVIAGRMPHIVVIGIEGKDVQDVGLVDQAARLAWSLVNLCPEMTRR